VLFIFLKI